MSSRVLKLRRRQQGVVLPLVVIAMFSLLGMGALALDVSLLFLAKTRIQNAVDAAALSGARTLGSFTGNTTQATADATTTYQQYASQINFGEAAPALQVQYSERLRPFTPGATGPNARFVRARLAADAPIRTYLARVIPGVGDSFAVNASAVAGPQFLSPPSPTDDVCDLTPFVVGAPNLGDTDCTDGSCFGYTAGQLVTFRAPPGNSSNVGPGNYQIVALDNSTGKNDARENMAAGKSCASVGDRVNTEPGQAAGPVQHGLNTRFGVYNPGPLNIADGRPDVVTARPLTYTQYVARLANPAQYDRPADGIPRRRVISILLTDPASLATANGRTSLVVAGVACFFLQNSIPNGSGDVQGEFVAACDPDGLSPGVNPPSTGFFEIVLYKDPDGGVS